MGGDATSILVGLLAEFEALGLAEARIPELLSRLAGTFYVTEEAARRAVASTSSFNLLHLDTGHKIDLFVAGTSPLDVLQLETSRPSVLREGLAPVRVTSAPVLVLRKLLWFCQGGEVSERQWRDVAGVLRVQGSGLDLESVRSVAEELGLTELLDRAVREE